MRGTESQCLGTDILAGSLLLGNRRANSRNTYFCCVFEPVHTKYKQMALIRIKCICLMPRALDVAISFPLAETHAKSADWPQPASLCGHAQAF